MSDPTAPTTTPAGAAHAAEPHPATPPPGAPIRPDILMRPLPTRPDPALTLPQARTTVNVIRWRAALSTLFIEYDRITADTVTGMIDRLDPLLGQINTILNIDPRDPTVPHLPADGPPWFALTAEQALADLIVAANRSESDSATVEDLIGEWLRTGQLGTAVSILGAAAGQALVQLVDSPAPTRRAVIAVAQAWMQGSREFGTGTRP